MASLTCKHGKILTVFCPDCTLKRIESPFPCPYRGSQTIQDTFWVDMLDVQIHASIENPARLEEIKLLLQGKAEAVTQILTNEKLREQYRNDPRNKTNSSPTSRSEMIRTCDFR